MEKKIITLEDIKNWKPLSIMEDASEEDYLERIEGSYKVELPHGKLTLVPYIGEVQVIEYEYPELIGLCPVTFIPDIYNLKIRFYPNNYIPELKSLKLYLLDFYNIPISHEHLLSRIFTEFNKQIDPKEVYMTLDVNVRGGIKTRIEMGYPI